MKTILITGAANGVGKEVAKILKGNTLVLIDEDKKEFEKLGGGELSADCYVCDLSKSEEIETTIKEISAKYKKIDCLINCAGMWIAGEVSNMNTNDYKNMNKLDRIQKVIGTNVFGVVGMISSVYPIMEKQGYGQIININSQSGVEVEPMFPVYNATKHGSYAFRKAIQNDMANHNIKITDICPGLISNDFYKRAGKDLPKELFNKCGLSSAEVAKAVKYVFDLPHEITIPSLEIRHIKNY